MVGRTNSARFRQRSHYAVRQAAKIILVVGGLVLIYMARHGILFPDSRRKFEGPQWDKDGETKDRLEIASTKWLRLEAHTRRNPSTGKLIDDWLWVDVADQVNILVHSAETGLFHVFRQSKYGLKGKSLAVIGGLIEPGEEPLEAAKRELLEEMGLETSHENWRFLGKFRTDVNRGGGYMNSFLAWDCHQSKKKRKKSDDIEKQELVKLNLENLIRNLLLPDLVNKNAGFQEVKWSNTVALSILQILFNEAYADNAVPEAKTLGLSSIQKFVKDSV